MICNMGESNQIVHFVTLLLIALWLHSTALDAYCLLEVYECLKSQALAVDKLFNVEPAIESMARKENGKGQK